MSASPSAKPTAESGERVYFYSKLSTLSMIVVMGECKGRGSHLTEALRHQIF
jgi:hypothetical protein